MPISTSINNDETRHLGVTGFENFCRFTGGGQLDFTDNPYPRKDKVYDLYHVHRAAVQPR